MALKLMFLLGVLCASPAFAQNYYQVLNSSGTAAYGSGYLVTVSSANGALSGSYCGASPFALPSQASYTYTFSPSAGAVRLNVGNISAGDGFGFQINGGGAQPLSGIASVSTFNSSCGNLNTLMVNYSTIGPVSGTVGSCNITGGQVDFYPSTLINTLTIIKYFGNNNVQCPNLYYSLFFQPAGCLATVAATADTPCQGGTLHLATSSIIGATYSWAGPNSFTSTAQNPSISNASTAIAGTYTVTVTKDTCVYTATVLAQINHKPATPLITSNSPVCLHDTLKLSATSSGAVSYLWVGPAGFNAAQQSPSIASFSSANAGLYKVMATDANGCTSDSNTITALLAPSATAAFSHSARYGCGAPDTLMLSNNSVNSATNIWYFGDGATSTAFSPSHIYTSPGTYTVKLVARSANGCTDSSKQVIVLNHPLHAGFITDKDSLCGKGSIQFSNTSVAATQNGIAPAYLWLFGDGGSSTQTSPSHFFSAPGIYTVQLIAKNFVPCTDTITRTILVDSLPYLHFIASDTNVCSGTPIQFRADYLRSGNTGISWGFGDGNSIANQAAPVHSFAQGGSYTVMLTAHYPICPDTTFFLPVRVRQSPLLDLGRDTSLCPNSPTPLVLRDLLAGMSAGSYRWSTGETTTAITVNNPGAYWAVKSASGCDARDTIEVEKSCYMGVPNVFTPNSDGINDYFYPRQLLAKGLQLFRMRIYNRWGQMIYSVSGPDGIGWDGTKNGMPQSQGVYIYIIEATYIDGTSERLQGNVTLLR